MWVWVALEIHVGQPFWHKKGSHWAVGGGGRRLLLRICTETRGAQQVKQKVQHKQAEFRFAKPSRGVQSRSFLRYICLREKPHERALQKKRGQIQSSPYLLALKTKNRGSQVTPNRQTTPRARGATSRGETSPRGGGRQ